MILLNKRMLGARGWTRRASALNQFMRSRRLVIGLLLLSQATVIGCHEMRDPSPHSSGYIRVRDGTRLHYLDWGGRGPALILLAGLGGSAHTFDDLAPQLTDSFHVIGITRRGTGESDRPETGYDVPSRARDDIDVLDSLKVPSAIFVGHSIAGDELTELGSKFPQRVAGLLYLDAAYDRSNPPPVGTKLPVRPPSVRTFDELLDSRRRSYLGLPRAMETDLWKTQRGHDGELIASPPLDIYFKMLDQEKQWRPDRRDIKAPAVAIYAFDPHRPLVPGALADLDSAERTRLDAEWQTQHWAWQRQEIASFQREDPSLKVIELNPADHVVYFSNPREVIAAIRAFLPMLSGRDSTRN